MGVKDYLKHMELEVPEIKERTYDYLYLDCNYMLHYLIYKCKNDNDLYAKLYSYFEYLFDTVQVNKEILLIFDGEHEKEAKNNPKHQTHLLRAKHKKESDDYDKQHIYPKSKIIKTFNKFLIDVITKFKKINKFEFNISINDDEVMGEADKKITDSIFLNNQNNICILSRDSDMILISYSLIINKNIKIDILSNLRPIQFINVNKINNIGFDYLLIILLLGNDYLPKISNVSYDTIIESYNKYIKCEKEPLIINKKISFENLKIFISYIIINCKTKKIKFDFNKLDSDRFITYFNNLQWCLKEYKALDSNINFISEDTNSNDIKIKNVINIYNFINFV
jgi:hypothetical protein